MTNNNSSKEARQAPDQKIDRFNKRIAQTHIIGCFSIAFILCVAIGAMVVNRHLEREYEKKQLIRQSNREKTNAAIKVFNALIAMAELREITALSCDQENSPNVAQKRAQERIKLRYELLKASNLAIGYFGEDLRTSIEDFVAWEKSIVDYCAKDAPNKIEWLAKQQPLEDKLFPR